MISLTARGLIVLRLRKPLVVNVLCGGFQAHTKWPQIICTEEHHHHNRLPLLPQTPPRPLFPMMSVFWSRKQIEQAYVALKRDCLDAVLGYGHNWIDLILFGGLLRYENLHRQVYQNIV